MYNVAYKHQHLIPEDHRCKSCNGKKGDVAFGVVNYMGRPRRPEKMCNSCRYEKYIGHRGIVTLPELSKAMRSAMRKLDAKAKARDDIRDYFRSIR